MEDQGLCSVNYLHMGAPKVCLLQLAAPWRQRAGVCVYKPAACTCCCRGPLPPQLVSSHHAGLFSQVWYGVPASATAALEDAMRDALPHLFEANPRLLYQLVTMLSPMELQVSAGLPWWCCVALCLRLHSC